MDFIAALTHWVHLISAVIWVGGLAFVVMLLHPSLKDKFPKESIKELAKNLQGRYLRITGVLMTLILITGGLNVRFVRHLHLEDGGLSRTWLLFLGIKLTLATGLISIFLLNVLYRNEPPEEEETEIRWARPSFILGVFIVMMAAFLKHSHGL